MEKKVLISYATTHGSTREVAERIAAVLQAKHLETELAEAKKIHSLNGYDAAVLGVPLYMFKMHGDGRRFLSRFRLKFKDGLPLAIFAGGPMEPDKVEEHMKGSREQVQNELENFPEIQPKSVLIIGGRFDPGALKFPWNMIPAMKQLPAADLRDWGEITTWAQSLPDTLELGPAYR
ncbi:MAG: hypothetical protein JXA25_05360 [Anaerolineales bacterium]|nr:hypothetical protein [Anaerolineales bacterium]